MNINKWKCPACDGKMTRTIQGLHYIYKGKPLVVSALDALDALVCATCGEALFATPEDGTRYDAAIRADISAMNLSSAPNLRAIRKQLKLAQAEAGRIFGGGITTFPRQERGNRLLP